MLRIIGTAIGLLALGSVAAHAGDPRGTWFTEEQKSQVKIADCGAVLCGTIVSLKDPNDPKTGKPVADDQNPDAGKRGRPLIGVEIVIGMKPTGADKWSGQVYNVSDGKTYSGNITMSGDNTLKLQGCAMGGLLCKTQTWTRAN